MRRSALIPFVVAAVASLGVSTARAQTDPHAGHAAEKAEAPAAPAPRNETLPPDADAAKDALAKSPRHGEWVDVKLPDGGKVTTWVVFPEVKTKAGAVIVIHEIFGLSDWVRGVADQLAKEGFIALAPDLLTGKGPNGGGTDSLGEEATKVIRTLTPEAVAAMLNAVRDYALKLPAANGRVGSVGFCWGGTTSFAYAVAQPKLDAAVVYYGTSPSDPSAYEEVHAPVLGLYGGDDARVDATIDPARKVLSRAHRSYDPHVFDGAGHGFLRAQTQRDGANLRATQKAWPLTVDFLKKNLR